MSGTLMPANLSRQFVERVRVNAVLPTESFSLRASSRFLENRQDLFVRCTFFFEALSLLVLSFSTPEPQSIGLV